MDMQISLASGWVGKSCHGEEVSMTSGRNPAERRATVSGPALCPHGAAAWPPQASGAYWAPLKDGTERGKGQVSGLMPSQVNHVRGCGGA